jgi:hypothetical protein
MRAAARAGAPAKVVSMIWEAAVQIGGCGKGETINAASIGRRLVIEWTTQLPSMERHTVTGSPAAERLSGVDVTSAALRIPGTSVK